MEIWQLIVSVCAGMVTVLTLLDKIGVFKRIKQAVVAFNSATTLKEQLDELKVEMSKMTKGQDGQNQALLSILRTELYRCFKQNRDIEAWTDCDCFVQSKMHEAYKQLGGNGEETIWWQNKITWRIVSEEEYAALIQNVKV